MPARRRVAADFTKAMITSVDMIPIVQVNHGAARAHRFENPQFRIQGMKYRLEFAEADCGHPSSLFSLVHVAGLVHLRNPLDHIHIPAFLAVE